MEPILFEVQDHVAKISLNRPEKYNSFNRSVALAVQEKLKFCKDDDSVRAVYLTGMGKAFCAGQDLQEILDPEVKMDLEEILTEHFNPIVTLIREIEKPVVCGVNGVAAGAGANIAIACDITVASESASFIQAFSKIGLIPDSGGTFFLPRIIGFQKATALMMLGDKLSAKEACDIGLIYKVIPDENFQEDAFAIAKKLAKMPTIGLGLTKRALNHSIHNDLTTQLGIETALQTAASLTADYEEGVKAFVEKRKPEFTGS